MFKTRLLSGIVLVIIALATIICGGPVLFITLLCVSLIGMQELYRAVGVRKEGFNLLEMISYLGVTVYYLAVWLLPAKYHLPSLMLSILLIIFLVGTIVLPQIVNSVKSVISVIREKWPEFALILKSYDIDTAPITDWLENLDWEYQI